MKLRILLVICGLATSHACNASSADGEIAGWQVSWDNDVWGKANTDRWYTNGLRLTWTYNKPPTSAVSRGLLEGSKWLLWDGAEPTLSYSLGQTMYTPRDITRSDPQPADRPWGGFLFSSITAHAYRVDEFRATEIKYGVVGRYALAEHAQKFVHKYITKSSPPMGWDQQLKSRPGLQLSHTRVHRLGDLLANDRVGFQFGWGVATGTLRTHANLSVAAMVGDLSGKNAPVLVGNEGDFVVQDFNNRPQFSKLFAYFAASVTAVAHNHFLDGKTPYGYSDVERKKSYTMVTGGISIPLQKWINESWPRLVYSQTSRSAEFSSPSIGQDERRQHWGNLALHWDLK